MTTDEAIQVLTKVQAARQSAAERMDWYVPDQIGEAIEIMLKIARQHELATVH